MTTPPDSNSQPTTTPAEAKASAGARRTRPATKSTRNRTPRPRPGGKSLINTAGPSPNDDLANIKLTVGVIAGTHGVHGDLKLKLVTDNPEHLPKIKDIFLGDSEEPTAVMKFRFHGDQGVIRLAGIDNPEDGKRLGGLKVRIRGIDAAPLAEGEYFLFQLIGLRVESPSGELLGEVTDLLETGANDVLVITDTTGDEVLVPNHPNYVHDILPSEGRIVVELPVYYQ